MSRNEPPPSVYVDNSDIVYAVNEVEEAIDNLIQVIKDNKPVRGKALAHGWIDNGIEHDLQWVCFLDSNGECWTFHNSEIRGQMNITHGRDYISPFYDPKDYEFKRRIVKKSQQDSEPARQQDSKPVNDELFLKKEWMLWGDGMPKSGKFYVRDIQGKCHKSRCVYDENSDRKYFIFPSTCNSRIISWCQEDEWITECSSQN